MTQSHFGLLSVSFVSFVLWEGISEHGSATFRLLFCGLILNDVPMLGKDSVLNAHNICGNPIRRSTETAKPPVHDHEVSLSHDHSRFVLQRWWNALDKGEKTLTARCDMSAVLNVVRGPVALGRCIVTLVEQCVKGLEDERFVLLFNSLIHVYRPSRTGALRTRELLGRFAAVH